MQKIKFTPRSVPLALLALCLLSFGLLVPWLGFYWDDWPTIWHLHQLGPGGFEDVFAVDRPPLGWLFTATTALLGKSPLAWQSFAVLARWLSCLALWWTLRLVWPQSQRQAAWAALLFAVYPGFLQQPISVTYGNEWVIVTAFLASLGLMLLAVRRPRAFWPLMAASWLLSTYVMFADEYYFGLELLRPVFLWLVLSEQVAGARRRLARIAFLFAPYLASMLVFLYWRLVLQATPRGQVTLLGKLGEDFLGTLLGLTRTVIKDVFLASLGAWAQVFNVTEAAGRGVGQLLAYAAVVLATAALAIFYLAKFQADSPALQPSKPAARWSVQAVLIGLLALLVAGWPFWMTGLPIELRFPWDRFTLPMMLGASLMLAGLLDLAGSLAPARRRKLAQAALLGALVGLAAGRHFVNANGYRLEWQYQKAFFWQLSWRAPGIQPGTTLLTTELPFTYFTDYALTAPLNWTYAPENRSSEMSYLLYSIESRLGARLSDLEENLLIHQPYRTNTFNGSTSQVLVVYFTPPGCVKVADPQVDKTSPQKPKFLSESVPLSDLGLVQASGEMAARPPAPMFGGEPRRDWCYYFEKADLARQQGDWKQVAALGDEAFALGQRLYPVNAPEYTPFIEAYAHTGQWQRAQALTGEAQALTFRMQRMLCATWERIAANTPASPEKQAAVEEAQAALKCSRP